MSEQQSSHERALARLAEMEARASKATPGPWHADAWEPWEVAPEDMAFIASIRTDAPRAYAAIRAVLELHALEPALALGGTPRVCNQCLQVWPCPTVTRLAQALEGELWLTVNRR